MAFSTQPEVDSGKCYLLDISGELRNRIYRYAVIDTDPIRVLKPAGPEDQAPTGLEAPPPEPAIASTNKQNTFDVAHVSGYMSFDLQTGFHARHSSGGLCRWHRLLNGRSRLLRHLVARSITEETGNFTVSASLGPKTRLVDVKVQHHSHGKVADVCACPIRAQDSRFDGDSMDGFRLLLIIQSFCYHYLVQKIQQVAAQSGIAKNQHCEKCSCLSRIHFSSTEADYFWVSGLSPLGLAK